MARSRPGSGAVTTIAIFHFIGGGVGLIQSLCGGINLIGLAVIAQGNAPGNDPGVALEAHLLKNVSGYFPVLVATVAVGLIFDILLIAAGIGLLMRHGWARYASIVYAVFSLLFKLGLVAFYLALVVPVAQPFLEQNPPPQFNAPGQQQGFILGAVYGTVCFRGALIIYPLIVLGVMMMPSVKRYFDRSRDQPEDDDDYRSRPQRDREDRDDYRDDRDRDYRDRRDPDDERDGGRFRRDDDR